MLFRDFTNVMEYLAKATLWINHDEDSSGIHSLDWKDNFGNDVKERKSLCWLSSSRYKLSLLIIARRYVDSLAEYFRAKKNKLAVEGRRTKNIWDNTIKNLNYFSPSRLRRLISHCFCFLFYCQRRTEPLSSALYQLELIFSLRKTSFPVSVALKNVNL